MLLWTCGDEELRQWSKAWTFAPPITDSRHFFPDLSRSLHFTEAVAPKTIAGPSRILLFSIRMLVLSVYSKLFDAEPLYFPSASDECFLDSDLFLMHRPALVGGPSLLIAEPF